MATERLLHDRDQRDRQRSRPPQGTWQRHRQWRHRGRKRWIRRMSRRREERARGDGPWTDMSCRDELEERPGKLQIGEQQPGDAPVDGRVRDRVPPRNAWARFPDRTGRGMSLALRRRPRVVAPGSPPGPGPLQPASRRQGIHGGSVSSDCPVSASPRTPAGSKPYGKQKCPLCQHAGVLLPESCSNRPRPFSYRAGCPGPAAGHSTHAIAGGAVHTPPVASATVRQVGAYSWPFLVLCPGWNMVIRLPSAGRCS